MMWLIGLIIVCFGAVVLRGAPYVPSHRKTLEEALDILELKPGDRIIDLGSGDGVLLKAAAQRGIKATGYELNPLLCLIAWLRTWRLRKLVTIRVRDFWLTSLPPDTKAVYVFLAGPFMRRLHNKLERECAGRSEPFYVVSHGFAIPGYVPVKTQNGLHVYKIGQK